MKKNPLNSRFIRDLRDDLGKYVVIALLMIFTIGFVSGFLVADGSMSRPTMRASPNIMSRTETSALRRK